MFTALSASIVSAEGRGVESLCIHLAQHQSYNWCYIACLFDTANKNRRAFSGEDLHVLSAGYGQEAVCDS